jgi:hypothetical protein
MDDRVERRIRARQTRVEHNGKTFVIRRPTDWEVFDMGEIKQMDLLEKFVDGWDGFTDADLFPGGDTARAEFSKALFADWLQDNPDFWAPLSKAITKEYQSHATKVEDAKKK